MINLQDKFIKTDILVIGGGFAGVFAALRARKQGMEVTLVDKGSVGRSGQTPWADSFHVFDEEKGHTKEVWRKSTTENGYSINNLGFLEMLLDDSKSVFEELKSWGAVGNTKFGLVFERKLRESGVNIVSRTMITELLKKGDKVVGAIGFPLDEEYTSIVINAKAVINCAGAGSYKANGFPIQGLTFDGDAISYRAGAEITGKEFNDFHVAFNKYPGSAWYQWGGKWGCGIFAEDLLMPCEANNRNVEMFKMVADAQLPISFSPPHIEKSGEGKIPDHPPFKKYKLPENSPECIDILKDGFPIIRGGAAAGLGIHKSEGVFPKNGKVTFQSKVDGLFAAGDALGSMMCGAAYSGLGFSSAGSCIQGARAAIEAVEYIKLSDYTELEDEKIEELKLKMFEPLLRVKGYDAGWVIQQLQNVMIPYYTLQVKEDSRLRAALNTITYLGEKVVPRIKAKDNHELKLAHEAVNMILNAEMKLRAGLFRTETRGTHYREDYPEINNEEWIAWVVISKSSDGTMELRKHPIQK